jgi:hypothetical protein
MSVIDNESEPGAWKREIDKIPWRFKHIDYVATQDVLAALRANGFINEAQYFTELITRLQADNKYLTDKVYELQDKSR